MNKNYAIKQSGYFICFTGICLILVMAFLKLIKLTECVSDHYSHLFARLLLVSTFFDVSGGQLRL